VWGLVELAGLPDALNAGANRWNEGRHFAALDKERTVSERIVLALLIVSPR
jgi:hypothetical protein